MNAQSPTVALFGGSFNPPHVSHVMMATLVLTQNDVDRVLVVPTFQHPFAKALAPFEDRVAMCELALGWIPQCSVSRVEAELGGESKTLRTLEHLAAKNPSWRFRLLMGADLVTEAHKWFRFDDVVKLAPPIVFGRVGVNAPNSPPPLLPDISSTRVRELLGQKDFDAASTFVPRRVLAYVRERGLYAEEA